MVINNFNKIFREDPYVIDLCKTYNIEYSRVEAIANLVYQNMFFDTMDNNIIQMWTEIMDIMINENLSIEDKRATVEAKWKSKGKCTEPLMQSVCNAWNNGEITITFIDDVLSLHFASIGGVPNDIDILKDAINKVKPAYLLIDYIFNYLYWNLWDSWDLSWDEFESKNLSWDELEITIFKP